MCIRDSVYRKDDGAIVHCEASVKFFLHHPRAGVSHFPGPNATDNYERKMSRLFDRQLPLSQQHWPGVDLRYAFVKGMVFWRDGVELLDPPPERMPEQPLAGRWLRASDVDSLREHRSSLAAVAHKPHWLAPTLAAHAVGLGDVCDFMTRHFDGPAYLLMLSTFDATTGDESERLFVVSDHWPEG